MNKKQINAKIAEITKLTDAKKSQKEAEASQIRKAREDTHSKIKSLESELKEAEVHAEVDKYISVAGNISSANAFLKILDQKETDLFKPSAEEKLQTEEFKADPRAIHEGLLLDTTERLKSVTEQILKIFSENDTALDTAKTAVSEYCRSCGAEGIDKVIIPLLQDTTWLMNFYLAAVKFNEAVKTDDYYTLIGISKER